MLDGVARALHLDETERTHLFGLVRALNDGAHPTRRRSRPPVAPVRAGLQLLLDSMSEVPAMVQNAGLDILAANSLGRALYAQAFEQPQLPVNVARYLFLDPRARAFFRDWDDAARQTTAILRTEAGRVPHDRALSDLVGELATRSDDFRVLWGTHDVRDHRTGHKNVTHPLVGDLDLTYELMDLTTDHGLTLTAYTAEPGSATAEAVRVLASWSTPSPSPSPGARAATSVRQHEEP